jgi:hypothetical protein
MAAGQDVRGEVRRNTALERIALLTTIPTANSTGNSSSSTTARQTAPKKSPHSSKKSTPPNVSRSAPALVNSVLEPPTSMACNSQPATSSSSWTPTFRITPSSLRL